MYPVKLCIEVFVYKIFSCMVHIFSKFSDNIEFSSNFIEIFENDFRKELIIKY